MNKKDIFKNVLIGGMQKHQSIKSDGICTCLTSSMGTGGGICSHDSSCRKNKISIIAKWMIDKKHDAKCDISDYACTLLARDWKGVNNYGFNLVVVKK